MSDESAGRYLITGGAGFIGSRLINQLRAMEPGCSIAVVDNLSVGLPMPSARTGVDTFELDIREIDSLQRLALEYRPDTVVHLAAVHHIPTCERKRSYALEVNVTGTEGLLGVAEAAGVDRFILASSGAVYDWQEGELAEADSRLLPRDNYSLSKYANERQLAFWADRGARSARIARIFNTIGRDDPNAHLIPDIIEQIPPGATRASIALGNLSPRRDYIHVEDTARALALIATRSREAGLDVFNVASGSEIPVAALVDMLGDVLGVHIEIEQDSSRIRRIDRPSQLGSIAKIRSRLGFKVMLPLRSALSDIAGDRAISRIAAP